MLQEGHRAGLLADTQVEGWHFEQYEGEVVFIPAGCPHQVRNLRPCTKVRQPARGMGRWDGGVVSCFGVAAIFADGATTVRPSHRHSVVLISYQLSVF
jgi:hypothetical protein